MMTDDDLLLLCQKVHHSVSHFWDNRKRLEMPPPCLALIYNDSRNPKDPSTVVAMCKNLSKDLGHKNDTMAITSVLRRHCDLRTRF